MTRKKQSAVAVESLPHVVIVGGGFGGLCAALALSQRAVRVTLVDRNNYHLFQPLLYQVATASLSAGDIASPIRSILSRAPRVRTLLGEVTSIDLPNRRVLLNEGELNYDYLIVAAGSSTSYFGHDHWQEVAPTLKLWMMLWPCALASSTRSSKRSARRMKPFVRLCSPLL
jgi:NADH dehydrogenase